MKLQTVSMTQVIAYLLPFFLAYFGYYLNKKSKDKTALKDRLIEVESIAQSLAEKGCEYHINVIDFSENKRREVEAKIISDSDILSVKISSLEGEISGDNLSCLLDNYAELSTAITEAPFRGNIKPEFKVYDYRINQIRSYSMKIVKCVEGAKGKV